MPNNPDSEAPARIPDPARRWRVAVVILSVVVLGLAVTNVVLLVQLPTYAPAEWLVILLFFVASGAFGGILALASRDQDGETGVSLFDRKAQLVAVLGGIGGAIAGLSILVLDDKITAAEDPTKRRLIWICVGAVGGFIGFRLLKAVSEELAKLARQAKKEADQAKQQASLAQEDAGEAKKQAQAATEQAIGFKDFQRRRQDFDEYLLFVRDKILGRDHVPGKVEVLEAIGRVEQYQKDFPDHRTGGIVLARLHVEGLRDREALHQAIAVLTRLEAAVLARQPKTQADDRDLADLRYNRACYRAELGDWAAAAEDFATSFRRFPVNLEFARRDRDFAEAVRNHPPLLDVALDAIDAVVQTPGTADEVASGLLVAKAGFLARRLKEASGGQRAAYADEIAKVLARVRALTPEVEPIRNDPDLRDVMTEPAIQAVFPVPPAATPPAPSVSRNTTKPKRKR